MLIFINIENHNEHHAKIAFQKLVFAIFEAVLAFYVQQWQ